MKNSTKFNSMYFMPQQELTMLILYGVNQPINKFEEALRKQGLNPKKSCFGSDLEFVIRGFSEDYTESHNQIKNLLETTGVPEFIYDGYQYFDDRVGFESVSFNGTTVLLSNFFSSNPWRPKWAQFKFVGEIVNYGSEIYAIKLPRFKRDYIFLYPVTENGYNSFRHCDYHTYDFKDGMFLQIIEFPPIFLLRGFTHAVDFFERFLEINGFDLTDYSKDWFPDEYQAKAYYL